MNPLLLIFSVLMDLARQNGRDELAEALGLAGDLVRAGRDGSDEYADVVNEIQAMVDAGRDPTPLEIESVRERRAALSAELRTQPTSNETVSRAGQDGVELERNAAPGDPEPDDTEPA